MNRPLGIGDFLIELKEASFKGDTPGHPFRGNQFDGGSGSASTGQALPKPKVLAGHEIHDSFTNKKGNALYTLQKPVDNNEKGWAIIKTMRRDKDKSAVHFYESTGKRDDVMNDFNMIKRYEG